MWTVNSQMFKLDLEKAKEPEIELPTSIGSLKKQESSRKTSTSTLLTMPKPLTVWITTAYGKFWKRWEYHTTWPASWEICMQVRKQQLELNVEQQTGSKSGKEYVKAVYCHPPYLTYMQNISREMLGQMKHKLGSRLLGEISVTSDMQVTPTYGRKWRRTKEPLDEREECKIWVKTQHSETKIIESGPITSWQIDEETMETVRDFILGAPKSLQMVTTAMKLKDTCFLEEKLWPT